MSNTAQTAARARSRSAEPGHTARLIEAEQYLLAGGTLGPDLTFRRGQEVAVSEQVYAHLAAQTRLVTRREAGRIVQEQRRLFALTDPSGNTLPKTHSETVRHLDGTDEIDPWA